MKLEQNPTEVLEGVLKGLSVYYDSPFLMNLKQLIIENPHLDIESAVNSGQMESKKWLIDSLLALDMKFECAYILGGWYGVLSALLLENPKGRISQIHSFDIDPVSEKIAVKLNREHYEKNIFRAWTKDLYKISYENSPQHPRPDLVINTVCEHILDLKGWVNMIPKGTLLVMQSNNYFKEPDHVNCVSSLDEFISKAPLSKILFKGEKVQRKYTRYQLIGFP